MPGFSEVELRQFSLSSSRNGNQTVLVPAQQQMTIPLLPLPRTMSSGAVPSHQTYQSADSAKFASNSRLVCSPRGDTMALKRPFSKMDVTNHMDGAISISTESVNRRNAVHSLNPIITGPGTSSYETSEILSADLPAPISPRHRSVSVGSSSPTSSHDRRYASNRKLDRYTGKARHNVTEQNSRRQVGILTKEMEIDVSKLGHNDGKELSSANKGSSGLVHKKTDTMTNYLAMARCNQDIAFRCMELLREILSLMQQGADNDTWARLRFPTQVLLNDMEKPNILPYKAQLQLTLAACLDEACARPRPTRVKSQLTGRPLQRGISFQV